MKLSLTLSLPVLAVISVAGFSAPAFADDHCPDIPNGKWWGNASHAKIIKYVNKKHDGDWLPYIVKWDRQLKKMKRVFANDGVAVFKKRGLALRDAELLEYIQPTFPKWPPTRSQS